MCLKRSFGQCSLQDEMCLKRSFGQCSLQDEMCLKRSFGQCSLQDEMCLKRSFGQCSLQDEMCLKRSFGQCSLQDEMCLKRSFGQCSLQDVLVCQTNIHCILGLLLQSIYWCKSELILRIVNLAVVNFSDFLQFLVLFIQNCAMNLTLVGTGFSENTVGQFLQLFFYIPRDHCTRSPSPSPSPSVTLHATPTR